MTAEVSKLKSAVEEIQSLKDDLSRAQIDILQLQKNTTLWLDPTRPKNYQRLDTDMGYFLVSLQEASPYLDGYKVVLHVGNPSTANFIGYEVKAIWGKRFGTKGMTLTAWKASLQEKTISSTDTLSAGTWNRVELVLAPASAENMGHLAISIGVNTVGFGK